MMGQINNPATMPTADKRSKPTTNIIPQLTQMPNMPTKYSFGDNVKIVRGFYKGNKGRILNVKVEEERRMIGNFKQVLRIIYYEVFIEGWGSLWCTENDIKKAWF